ncbi:3-ketoacyl-CoA reductase [Amylostereum chailletii]|nr:3-ketoacyl-CoA reductase [Amylostereum chailletii]
MAASLQLVQAHLSEHPYVALALQVVGALSAASFLFSFSTFFFRTFLRPGISLKKFGSRDGAWAVVTGASDGIGREFALQLAKAGFNVLIAARNPEKLAAVAREIADKSSGKAEVRAFTIDFAHADEATWENFGKTIQSLDVGVLVNNVGKSHEMPTDFVETPADEISDILAINVNATVRVTSIVTPGLVSRRRGLILNLGSFAGSAPSPMLATYSASKAFLATFSDALAAELGPKGIVVEHSNTYFVVSAMSKIRRPSLMIPTPAAYVRSVLAKIAPGTQAPFWTHAALAHLMNAVSTGVVVSYMHALHRDIRKRALRKKERLAKQN